LLKQVNPLALLDAQSQIVLDIGRAALGRSIDLAKEGKWAEAMSTLLGTNVNWGAAIGGLGRLRRLRAAVEAEAEIQRAARAATEGTQAAVETARLPLSKEPGVWVEQGRRGGPSLEHQAQMSGQQIVVRDGKQYIKEYEVRAGELRAVFDDFRDGALIDYKDDYSSFIGRDGLFTRKPWFQGTGIAGLREEAINQLRVAQAKGLPIVWHVGEAQVKAFRDVLRDIPGITVKP
jgi:hypothetical protein